MSGWHPWGELRRRDHIVFAFDRRARWTGGAFYSARGSRAAIVMDPALPRRERSAALTHELVHDEQGAEVLYRTEERHIDDEVARRLVPRSELVEFVAARCTLEEGGTALEVADEFDVPVEVAERALRLLEDEWA